MKVRLIEFEGTVEEYEQTNLRVLVGSSGVDKADSRSGSEPMGNGVVHTLLPSHVGEFLETNVPRGDAREIVERLVTTVLGWGDVSIKPAGGKSEGKYLR